MPRTKFQEIIYAILMTFFMVLAMEIYNAGLHMGGLTNQGILNALSEMPIMFPICFVTGFFFIDRIAPKIAFRLDTWKRPAIFSDSDPRRCHSLPDVSDNESLGNLNFQSCRN